MLVVPVQDPGTHDPNAPTYKRPEAEVPKYVPFLVVAEETVLP